MKCTEAASFEGLIQNLIKESVFDPALPSCGTPHLVLAEKQLLSLATYSKCTDGILYATPLIFEVKGENHLYIR